MADENDSSIFNLIINSDPEDAERLFALLNQLTQSGMSAAEAFEKINAEATGAADALNQVANASAQAGEASTQAFEKSAEGLSPYITQLGEAARQTERVNDLLAQMREQAQEAASAIPEPPPFPGLEDQGGGVGGGGSLFGVGHAFSVAGHSLGVPALREAGGFIYIEEGLKRVVPLMEQFGQAAATSSPQITGMVAGITGLGLPMAGLLAVAVPLAVAIGAIVIAFKIFEDHLKDSREALKNALATQMEYYQAVQTLTTKEAEIKKASLEQTVAGEQQAKAETERAIEALQKQTNINMELGKTLPGSLGDPFRQLSAQLDKNNEAIAKDGSELERFTGGLKSNAFAINDARAAWEAMDKAALAGAEATKSRVVEYLNDQDMANKGEVDSAKNKSAQLKTEMAGIDAAWLDLLEHGDKNSQAVQDQLKAYSDAHNKLAAEIDHLDTVIIPAAQSAKDFTDSIKSADEALKAANEAHETYLKAVRDADTQLANQEQDAATKEMQQEQVLTQGSIQDSYQRSQIALAESRKETTLAQDTANAIADVRTKLGQKEIADLTDYNRKLFDDRTKYQQDVQKDQTGAYRQERDNLQTHLEKLADIQRKEATDQQDALLNRNFLALAKVQQGHSNEIDAENTAYARKQATVQQHLQDELADLATHQAEVRTQQFVEFQRKLIDDRLHAQQEIDQKNVEESRKLAVLRQSEQQQLADLTTTETYKLAILRQGFAQEIAMYELQNQRRIQAAKQAEADFWTNSFKANPVATSAAATGLGLSEALGTASGFVNLLFGNNKKDTGGTFGAGEAFTKGNIMERFDFGNAGSYMIPGAAMVMPLQGGTATPGGGGHNINITVPISGGGSDIPAKASKIVYDKLREIFD